MAFLPGVEGGEGGGEVEV